MKKCHHKDWAHPGGWALPVLGDSCVTGAWHTAALPCSLSAAVPAMKPCCSFPTGCNPGSAGHCACACVCVWGGVDGRMCVLCLRSPAFSPSSALHSPVGCLGKRAPHGYLSIPAVVSFDHLQKLLLLGLLVGALRDLVEWQRGKRVCG